MTHKCLKYGEEHATEKCIYLKQFEEKTKEVKCRNCSQNHTSSYHKSLNSVLIGFPISMRTKSILSILKTYCEIKT
jgi:hypothetical protein